MKKDYRNSTGYTPAEALGAMLLPHGKRTTRSAEYWATRFGFSTPKLYKVCDGSAPFTVQVLIDATRETGDPLALEAVATACGYVAMKLAQTEIPADIPMLEQINDAVQQSAEAVRAICEAVKDGIATQEERDNVDREMMEMITSFTRARARLHELPSKPVDNVTPMRRDVM